MILVDAQSASQIVLCWPPEFPRIVGYDAVIRRGQEISHRAPLLLCVITVSWCHNKLDSLYLHMRNCVTQNCTCSTYIVFIRNLNAFFVSLKATDLFHDVIHDGQRKCSQVSIILVYFSF